jgi:type II secretory pathway pseudopilin PulG
MSPTPISSRQEGFTLAALLVVLTIIAIVVAYTVPAQWSLVMKRDRDRQTIFYMKQYARAIMEWQTKHANTSPVSLDQIQEARKPRLIRGVKKWACPLTGSDEDWILVPPTALMPDGGGIPVPPGQPPPPPGMQGQTMKLNKELSPKDYVGVFVAVRPNASGKSFITLKGAEDYSEWVYTVDDLRAEIAARQAALAPK